MLVYTCKKRFFCPELNRNIPVGAEILRYENIGKLTIKEFNTSGRQTVYHYTTSIEVEWFYSMELSAGFFTPKGKFQESVYGTVVEESVGPALTLKVLSTNQRNIEGNQRKGAVHFNTDRSRIEVFDGQVWLNEDLTKLKNESGGDLYEGTPVVINKAFDNAVATTDEEDDDNVIGVVVDGSLEGMPLTVATQGVYRVRVTGSVSRGDFISSGDDGNGKSVGTTKTSSVFGIAVQGGNDNLIKVFILKG